MPISGWEIRREQAESRRRSQWGARRSEPKSTHLVMDGVTIDGLVPLLALHAHHLLGWGVVVAVVAASIRFLTSTRLSIEGEQGGARVTLRWPRWRRRAPTTMVIEAAAMRYYRGWFCRWLELRGSNFTLVASHRPTTPLVPPIGLTASAAPRPPLGLTLRSVALNLPNLLVMGASALAAAEKSTVVPIFALLCARYSLTACLCGAPELVLSGHRDDQGRHGVRRYRGDQGVALDGDAG